MEILCVGDIILSLISCVGDIWSINCSSFVFIGSGGVVEVIAGVLNRLCTDVDKKELGLMYTCLLDAIKSSMENDCIEHLNLILGLLSFAIQTTRRSKSFGKRYFPLFCPHHDCARLDYAITLNFL
jgi:hypothetical protein